jgi:hypothetical protein
MADRFNWRPMTAAPRDGTAFVVMTVITHVGGWARPIDVTPAFEYVRRAGVNPVNGGYWQRVIPPAMERLSYGTSVGDSDLAKGWWTTPEEFAAAVPTDRPWRSAPTFIPGTICCPLVFIRPAVKPLPDFGVTYDAVVAWPTGSGPTDGWRTVRGHDPTRTAHPGYLDGENVAAQPFQWLMLNEFFPAEFFERQIAHEREIVVYRIKEWEQHAAAHTPSASSSA